MKNGIEITKANGEKLFIEGNIVLSKNGLWSKTESSVDIDDVWNKVKYKVQDLNDVCKAAGLSEKFIAMDDGTILANGEIIQKEEIKPQIKLDFNGLRISSNNIEVGYEINKKDWDNLKQRLEQLEKKTATMTTQPLQPADPPFLVDANINGRYYETDSTSQLGAICNRYRFNRNARYVVFEIAMMSSQNKSESKALFVPVGSDESIKSVSHFSNKESVYKFFVDFGKPDGSTFELDLRLKTYQDDNKAYCRVLRAYQTGELGKDSGIRIKY